MNCSFCVNKMQHVNTKREKNDGYKDRVKKTPFIGMAQSGRNIHTRTQIQN